MTQFDRWLQDAIVAELPEPNAMVLATAKPTGEVASRTVLCKGVDAAGIVFYTNLGSDKSRDLQANPWAAATFPWIGLQRQVHVRGPVERVSDELAEAYWATRPRGSRLGAWASPQSSVLPDRAALERLQDRGRRALRWPRRRRRSAATSIPLPDFWGGWRIVPTTVEFWQGRLARLHDRLRYRHTRSAAGSSSVWPRDGRRWSDGPPRRSPPAAGSVPRQRSRRRAGIGDRPDGRAVGRSIGPDIRPLAIPAYRRLFIGQVFTVVGAMITTVAVQQQVFDLTGSSAWVGFASLVALVPLVVFGLLGGAIADTYDRRKLLIVTSVGIAVTSIGLWLAALVGSESVWTVFALLALQQAFFAVNQPTRSAIIPRIVPIEMVPSANALGMTVFSLGVIVGPLLVGVLIPIVGLAWLYFIDALTLVAILYAVMRLPPIPPLGERRGRAKVVDGLRYLWLKPLLLMTFVVDIIAMVFGMPRALFPQMAEETFGGAGRRRLPVRRAERRAGGRRADRRTDRRLDPPGAPAGHRDRRRDRACGAPSMALFGTTSILWLAAIFLAVGGWADLVSAVYRSTILQVNATDEMRGRMQGVFTVVVAGGPRVADLVHGLVASATSTAFATTAGGIATIVLTLVAAAIGRSLVRYDTRDRTDSGRRGAGLTGPTESGQGRISDQEVRGR